MIRSGGGTGTTGIINTMDYFDIPILFIVFKRLDTTKRVFEKIKEVRPKRLFVVADGPRTGHPEEIAQCQAVRNYILQSINWDCDFKIRFRDENSGVRRSPPDGISWFFNSNDRGIILEDDCLPNGSFFIFAREILDRYVDNESIMCVSGGFFQKKEIGSASYYFSQIPHVWGWATWSRAWKKYDIDMKTYPDFLKMRGLHQIFDSDYCRTELKCLLDQAHNPQSNSWDFQWAYALFENHGLAVTPNKNLVENIGFGPGAENSLDAKDPLANLHVEDLSFPLTHPARVFPDKVADEYDSRHYRGFSVIKYVLCKVGLFIFAQKIYRSLTKW